jgi:hypothetical protein
VDRVDRRAPELGRPRACGSAGRPRCHCGGRPVGAGPSAGLGSVSGLVVRPYGWQRRRILRAVRGRRGCDRRSRPVRPRRPGSDDADLVGEPARRLRARVLFRRRGKAARARVVRRVVPGHRRWIPEAVRRRRAWRLRRVRADPVREALARGRDRAALLLADHGGALPCRQRRRFVRPGRHAHAPDARTRRSRDGHASGRALRVGDALALSGRRGRAAHAQGVRDRRWPADPDVRTGAVPVFAGARSSRRARDSRVRRS